MKSILLLFLLLFFTNSVFGELEPVSVKEADSVTLHTNLTKIQKDDDIEWRYGDKGNLIAKYDGGEIKSLTYDDDLDGKFKGRLQLDIQTGDLTIRNIKTTDTGLYEVTNRHSLNKLFSLYGVSTEEIQAVSALVGDSVILHTDVVEIQNYDVIRWKFGPQNPLIAEINKLDKIFRTLDGADGRFRHRLQLDQTGSLIIKNTGNNHSGLYEVDISSSKHTIHKTFNVTVSGEIKPVLVLKGDSVTLHTGLAEVKMSDFTLWMCGDTVIAEMYKEAQRFYTYDGDDQRFKNTFILDNQTGSLTITNTRTINSGLYDLKISSSRRTINKRIIVTVRDSRLSLGAVAGITVVVLLVAAALGVIFCHFGIPKIQTQQLSAEEGSSVVIKTGATGIKSHDLILLQFRNKSIFISNGNEENSVSANDRNTDRLKLDFETGNLTFSNIRNTDTGEYKVLIFKNGKFSSKAVKISISGSTANRENKPEDRNTLLREPASTESTQL